MVDISLFASLGIILLAGTVVAAAAKFLRQPTIIAYLVAGLVIGPIGLRIIGNSSEIAVFSELGMAFLLFAVGIESDFSKLFKLKSVVVFGAVGQVLATSLFVFSSMTFLGLPFTESLYIALILSFSSTVIVVKILSEKNQIDSLHGRLIIGFAVVQDIIAVLILPVLKNVANLFAVQTFIWFFGSIAALAVLAIIMNRFVLPKALHIFSESGEIFYLIVLSTAFAFVSLAHFLDFSIAAGAFIGGLSLSSLAYNVEALGRISGIRDFFSTIFFVSLGMQITLSFAGTPLIFVALFLFVVYFFNPFVYFAIGMLSGYGSRIAFLIGASLGQASEFSFIIASQGFSLGQLSPELYSVSLLAITLSMATTPFIVGRTPAIYDFAKKAFSTLFPQLSKIRFDGKLKELEKLPKEEEFSGHIVIFGSGTFGSEIAPELSKHYRTIIIDHNPNVVAESIRAGMNAMYGDINNREIWRKVKLNKAKILVLALPFSRESTILLKRAKRENPEIKVFARAHYYADALRLYEAGADFVVLTPIVSANQMLKSIAKYLDPAEDNRITMLEDEFVDYLKEKVAAEDKERGLIK